MICGIATFGLWTGILATGFAAESRRRNFIQTWDLVSKVPFFQTLDPAAITEITHMLRRVEVPERIAVIRRGQGRRLHVLHRRRRGGGGRSSRCRCG